MKLNRINNDPSFGMAWKFNKKSLVGAEKSELDLLKNLLDLNNDSLSKATKGHLTTIYANVKSGEIESLSLRTIPRTVDMVAYARDKMKALKDTMNLILYKKQPEYEVYNIPFRASIQGQGNFIENVAKTVDASDTRFASKDRVSKYLGEDALRGEDLIQTKAEVPAKAEATAK